MHIGFTSYHCLQSHPYWRPHVTRIGLYRAHIELTGKPHRTHMGDASESDRTQEEVTPGSDRTIQGIETYPGKVSGFALFCDSDSPTPVSFGSVRASNKKIDSPTLNPSSYPFLFLHVALMT